MTTDNPVSEAPRVRGGPGVGRSLPAPCIRPRSLQARLPVRMRAYRSRAGTNIAKATVHRVAVRSGHHALG